MLLVFIVCYVALIYIAFRRKSSELIISPVFWLLIGWSLIVGLYFTSGIVYSHKLKFDTGMYLTIVLLIFIIFYFFGKKVVIYSNRKLKETDYKVGYEKKIWTSLYFKISIIGIMMWVFDVFRLNYIAYGYRIENFTISIIGVLGSILMPMSLIVWLYELAYGIRYNAKLPLRAYIAAGIYVVPAFVTAGRQALLIIALSTFITLIYSLNQNKNYKYKKVIKFALICAIFIFINYAIVISNVRAGTSNKQALFEFMFESYTSAETITFVNKFGIFKEVFLNGLYYYSHELPMFEVSFKNYDGPMFFGMSQLHYISRRLPDSLGLNVNVAQLYLDDIGARLGLSSHVWRTAIASFITDFGRGGAVFFTALLGFLIGRKKKIFRRKNSIYELVFQVIICVGILFSVQYSPFAETGWAYPLYWLLLIPIIEEILGKQEYKKIIKKEVDNDDMLSNKYTK